MFTKDKRINDLIWHNKTVARELTPRKAQEHMMFAETLQFLADDKMSYKSKQERVNNIFGNQKALKKSGLDKEIFGVDKQVDAIMFMKKHNNKKGLNLFGKELVKKNKK